MLSREKTHDTIPRGPKFGHVRPALITENKDHNIHENPIRHRKPKENAKVTPLVIRIDIQRGKVLIVRYTKEGGHTPSEFESEQYWQSTVAFPLTR
jgi:hypothetical protein